MTYFDIILVVLELIMCIVLGYISRIAEKSPSSKWKLLYLLPVVICLLMSEISVIDICLSGVYIGVFLLASGFFCEKRSFRVRNSVISAVCIIAAVPICMFSSLYHKEDYSGDFQKGFDIMKRRYVLTEHKEIDWDKLYDKYMPQFRKAEKDRDKVENTILWNCFCAEFHDGHVSFSPLKDETIEKACSRASGSDYGIVIVRLSDGRFIAADADETLEKLGIHRYTEIKSWDGMPPDEADKKSRFYEMNSYADIDNEKFYEGLFCGGTGGDSVEVEFVNDDGQTEKAVLPKLEGSYYDRAYKVMEKIDCNIRAGSFTFTKMNDTAACLRISMMMYDTETQKLDDEAAYRKMKNEIKTQVEKLQAEGIKDIIIDIRNNGGGSGQLVKAVASCFAPEGEHYYVTDAKWDTEQQIFSKDKDGKYIPDGDVTLKGENILGDDGRVVLLVNSYSGSASDHLTMVMREFENTTVMGFTQPNGSAQGVSGIDLKYGSLSCSSSVMLDRNGDIFIDSGTERQASDDIDIIIPFDEKAAHAIFDDDKDYVMDYALEYLK
ncbi:MAG: S41 family peptidase [Ruminococcus sp.]|nr:S41 family peptidase [Ruminococcus sp.]